MKKKILAIVTIGAMVCSLYACGTPSEEKGTPSDQLDNFAEEKLQNAVFNGVVLSVEGATALVRPNSDEENILSSGDQVYVLLPETLDVKEGEEVIVEYSGDIMESYPLQIDTISVNGIEIEEAD